MMRRHHLRIHGVMRGGVVIHFDPAILRHHMLLLLLWQLWIALLHLRMRLRLQHLRMLLLLLLLRLLLGIIKLLLMGFQLILLRLESLNLGL